MLNCPLVIPSFTHRRSDFAEAYQLSMQAAQGKTHCCGNSKATVLLAQLRFWLKNLCTSSTYSSAHLTPVQISSPRLFDTQEDRSRVMEHSTHLAIPHLLFFSCFHVVSQSSFPILPLPLSKSLHYIKCLVHNSSLVS